MHHTARIRVEKYTNLLLLLESGSSLGAGLLLALSLLEKSLGDQDVVAGRDGSTVLLRLVRRPAYRGMEQSAGLRIVARRDILQFG